MKDSRRNFQDDVCTSIPKDDLKSHTDRLVVGLAEHKNAITAATKLKHELGSYEDNDW